jgi:two-component system, OmpR family, sensor kinase
MFFKSIRWRLEIWHGLILLGVLAGLGLTAYELQRGRQFRRVDEELQRRVGELATALRMGAPPNRPGNFPPRRDRPSGPAAGDEPPPALPPRPNEDRPANSPGPPGRDRLPNEFHLPPRPAALFDEADTNAFYYVIWTRDGKELARSTNAPAEISMPAAQPGNLPQPPRNRGVFRELWQRTPPGEVLLAGRTVASEFGDLHRTAWMLTAVGGAILLLGLAGGWWIAGRAIRPIGDISSAAVKIAGGDLSQRINATETDSELGRLIAVLNSTFARLDAAFEQQRQFTSDAAHELRTPVSVLLTQTQAALNRERSASEYRETIEACQRAAQRMRRLIESLLELARLDAGQEPMKRMSFDLAQTARDCIDLIAPLAQERGLRVEQDLKPAPCVGDPERLAQVITNLLTNAIQYNHQWGEVKIATASEADSASLTISNTGPGIAAADLPRLFERFYRADTSRTEGRSGLGLAISRAIVTAHGGTIEVTSKEGVGTNFTVLLPRNAELPTNL